LYYEVDKYQKYTFYINKIEPIAVEKINIRKNLNIKPEGIFRKIIETKYYHTTYVNKKYGMVYKTMHIHSTDHFRKQS